MVSWKANLLILLLLIIIIIIIVVIVIIIIIIIIIIIVVIIISDSLHWCLQSYCLDGTEETEDEQLFETWLLLEYCDKGSLQDAVDRGWFHADQNGHIDSRTKPNMGAIRSAVAVSC